MRHFTELEIAILEQIDKNGFLTEDNAIELQTCIRGGADAGITGFIYYEDTCRFYDENRSLILLELIQEAKDYGYNSVANMAASFRCLRDYYTERVIEEQLLTANEDVSVKNALAWAALEAFAFSMEGDVDEFLND